MSVFFRFWKSRLFHFEFKISSSLMKHLFKTSLAWLSTGMLFQLSIGPVYLFLMSLAIEKSLAAGLVGVSAVTLVDYLYIILAILWVGKLLDDKKKKQFLKITSALVLIAFGLYFMSKSLQHLEVNFMLKTQVSLLKTFTSVFLLTISNPITIVFFSWFFTAKAMKMKYSKKELWIFGISVGLATPLFLGANVVFFSFFGKIIPLTWLWSLNGLIGFILVCFGILGLKKARIPS